MTNDFWLKHFFCWWLFFMHFFYDLFLKEVSKHIWWRLCLAIQIRREDSKGLCNVANRVSKPYLHYLSEVWESCLHSQAVGDSIFILIDDGEGFLWSSLLFGAYFCVSWGESECEEEVWVVQGRGGGVCRALMMVIILVWTNIITLAMDYNES